MSESTIPSEAGDRWWVSINGQARGPFTENELESLVSRGELTVHSYVCQTGQSAWKQLADLAGSSEFRRDWLPPRPPDARASDLAASCGRPSPMAGTTATSAKGAEANLPREILFDERGTPRIWPFAVATVVPYLGIIFTPMLGNPPEGPWGLALFAILIAVVLFWYYVRPDKQSVLLGVGGFVVTYLFAGPLLFAFQAASESQADASVPFGIHPTKLLPYLIHHVQVGYTVMMNPELEMQLSFFGHLFYTFISVAFCEELLKLAPVIFLLAFSKNYTTKTIVLVGACSGLGFGISESIYYHFNVIPLETASLTQYLARFICVPLLHASWAALSAAIYFVIIEDWKLPKSGGPFVVLFILLPPLLAILCSMGLHSIYNVLTFRIGLLAIIPIALSVSAAYWTFYFADNPARFEELRSETAA